MFLAQFKMFGSGALTGKMFLVRINENDKFNAYFRSSQEKVSLALRKWTMLVPAGLELPARARIGKYNPLIYFQ